MYSSGSFHPPLHWTFDLLWFGGGRSVFNGPWRGGFGWKGRRRGNQIMRMRQPLPFPPYLMIISPETIPFLGILNQATPKLILEQGRGLAKDEKGRLCSRDGYVQSSSVIKETDSMGAACPHTREDNDLLLLALIAINCTDFYRGKGVMPEMTAKSTLQSPSLLLIRSYNPNLPTKLNNNN